MIELNPYLYYADVIEWVDGDTLKFVIDLGFDLTFGKPDKPLMGRLVTIDTPERKEANFVEATQFAKAMAPEGATALIRTIKVNGKLKDNFGRYFVNVYSLDGVLINDALLASGLAVPYED
jgi:endonuclease YncB( thermonuclease family)